MKRLPSKFSANLSLLFREVPFLERFERAAQAGFDAVEFWWPRDESVDLVEAAIRDAGVKVALFNLDAGDMAAGDRGLLCDPQRQAEFTDNLPIALELARHVGCRQLNALLGLELARLSREDQLELAVSNLRWAAREAAHAGVAILIEAVNSLENGPYLVTHTSDALDLLKRVDEPNVALQYDVYHMQRMEGNLAATIRLHHERIAHVQIADCPGRGEPGTGEINFPYLFDVLANVNYSGYVGLEYVPTTANTDQSLGWLRSPAALAR